MTTTTPRRTGKRAAETAERKARLIVAAFELAAEGGYEAVMMRDVAARADVAIGTLYRHYTSKDQLLLAALAQEAAMLRKTLERRTLTGATPAERVAEVLRMASVPLEGNPKVTAAMLNALFTNDPEGIIERIVVRDHLISMIAFALEGSDVADIEGVIDVLGHTWFATLAFWASGLSDGKPMADRLERAAHLILDTAPS